MNTKFKILVIALMTLALIAGSSINLTRLRIKNISNVPVSMWLTPVKDGGMYYYFVLEEGTQKNPTEKVYTLIPGIYDFKMMSNGMTVTNPFCLPAADLDKTREGIQIEIKSSKKTMIFEKCIEYQDVPDQYNTYTGFWKDFDGLWRVMFEYVTR